MAEVNEKIKAAVTQIALHQATRHVFLCTGPRCCTPEEGQAAWDVLKEKIRDADLSAGPGACQRNKVNCLRICTGGPNMVVYPEGTWYNGMMAERIPRFVQEHLVEGQPIQEWIFAEHRLEK
jgi:(2Fe-2S) ferredoxin